ncbi:MAG TPA: VOC family protein [Vitreimonas sp.]|uniref:VOC family protein n=1 Tax=Vitreimonas sp. TaxID=3069702 RepID=UPI002D50F680|nr:VOC family protein [Vitreimonas sp.]HYD87035.1 VOC family protein [Vitreimonas sp.]
MAKVLGVGGVFFKTRDAKALRDWYARVLGFEFTEWGGVVFLPQTLADKPGSATVFSPMADGGHIAPSAHDYMFNFVVDDLDAVLARCAKEGVEAIHREESFNGRFAHIMDLEGRKVELWEPKPF